ncbi:hypothetical protein [Nannocystis sp. SCPEA4]|uniref:hypothetical protein n=1 Tax=Nannocystis sp. SCPEA4 TaxID=2996787 RepID=UPI002270B7ED|nr:hypothetical protein [Nannocystis sp. SCPEA4]MCY1057449.1 hypothetical protein [Nannocystis sp. SCPEA4]
MRGIFGSTGTVGSDALAALAARGRPTRAVHHSRPPSPRAREHARVDLGAGDGLTAALHGAETVFLATGDMVDPIGAELRRGPAPRPTVLEVTGQPARSFAAFAREHAAAWRA